jgi:uroporphyrinogen decarboxylase
LEAAILWRMNPETPERYEDLDDRMAEARDAASRGLMITQNLVGGYMYLRSLIGPEDLLYAFYDKPELIHACMEAWFELADAVIARHQEHVTLDEFFLAEDICYNSGPLISPAMMKAFLFPYYQQLIANIKARQLDPDRHLYVQVDTDGFADPVIPLYREAIGMDAMSPFEVAAGCDVVRAGREYPDLAIFGGIDKRVLASGRDAIDAELARIIPVMRARGGYIPTSDHGVPAEVPYADYLYYRARVVALGSA